MKTTKKNTFKPSDFVYDPIRQQNKVSIQEAGEEKLTTKRALILLCIFAFWVFAWGLLSCEKAEYIEPQQEQSIEKVDTTTAEQAVVSVDTATRYPVKTIIYSRDSVKMFYESSNKFFRTVSQDTLVVLDSLKLGDFIIVCLQNKTEMSIVTESGGIKDVQTCKSNDSLLVSYFVLEAIK